MNFSNIINLIKYTNTLNDKASNLPVFDFGSELQSHIDSIHMLVIFMRCIKLFPIQLLIVI